MKTCRKFFVASISVISALFTTACNNKQTRLICAGAYPRRMSKIPALGLLVVKHTLCIHVHMYIKYEV